jgi:23S rRNA (adenine2030-N6)-methyltransferase
MPLDGPLDGSLDGSLPCRYPGSPAIAAKLLRAGDRGACFELHPADFAALEGALGGDRRFSLRHEDGLTGLKSLLPPLCRRALVLIDPAYEDAAEYQALPAALEEALRRFPAGVYLVWYPLLGPGAPGSRRRTGDDGGLGEILMALNGGNRCRVELHTAPVGSPGLYGSGLALYNPPWTLKPELEAALPVLARLLGGGETGWDLDWRVQ